MFEIVEAAVKALREKDEELSRREVDLSASEERYRTHLDAMYNARQAELEAEFKVRQQQLERREHAVASVRELAAHRLQNIRTLEEAVTELERKRKESETEKRAAVKEKERLEGVCADLLAEKRKSVKPEDAEALKAKIDEMDSAALSMPLTDHPYKGGR